MRFPAVVLMAGVAMLTGCQSRYVEAYVVNATGGPVSLVEVDYPDASFGVQALAPGGVYHYHFKILGDGPTKVLWTDAAHHDHTGKGPDLSEGQGGSLHVRLTPTGAEWSESLTR